MNYYVEINLRDGRLIRLNPPNETHVKEHDKFLEVSETDKSTYDIRLEEIIYIKSFWSDDGPDEFENF